MAIYISLKHLTLTSILYLYSVAEQKVTSIIISVVNFKPIDEIFCAMRSTLNDILRCRSIGCLD